MHSQLYTEITLQSLHNLFIHRKTAQSANIPRRVSLSASLPAQEERKKERVRKKAWNRRKRGRMSPVRMSARRYSKEIVRVLELRLRFDAFYIRLVCRRRRDNTAIHLSLERERESRCPRLNNVPFRGRTFFAALLSMYTQENASSVSVLEGDMEKREYFVQSGGFAWANIGLFARADLVWFLDGVFGSWVMRLFWSLLFYWDYVGGRWDGELPPEVKFYEYRMKLRVWIWLWKIFIVRYDINF